MSEITAVCGKLADYRGLLGEGCVNIEEGRIAGILKEPPRDVVLYDYRERGYLIVPGLVDLHVHLRGLQLSYKEDEGSGTRAAASAGITLVVDMPNTIPKLVTGSALESKLEALEKIAVVDYGIYAGIPSSPEELRELTTYPIAGFKAYPQDLEFKSEMLRYIMESGFLLVVHSEYPLVERVVLEDELSRSTHRGCQYEALALDSIHGTRGARVHVTHASCYSTIKEAKRRGFTVDVTPHHLLYNNIDAPTCIGRVNPPLRGPEEAWSLLQALIEGYVDALASDHAPHSPTEKSEPLYCSPGFAWLELWPWLLFRLVKLGVIGLDRFLYLTSRGPAEILGLKDYGSLSSGSRANLLVLDYKYEYRFPGAQYSRDRHLHAFMATLVGKPFSVFVGGEPVILDGEPQWDAGLRAKINPFPARPLHGS